MANTKKSSTKSTTAKTKATKTSTKTVPAKKPAKKPAGASKKPTTYKQVSTKSQTSTTKSSSKDTKSKKRGGEIIFGIIMIVLALAIATGAIFYFCCGRNKDVVMIQTDGDTSIAGRYVELPEQQVKVVIPDSFKKMTDQEISDTKFAIVEDVKTAYASKEKNIIISVGLAGAQISNDEVKNYTNALKSALVAANAKDVTTGFYESDGHNVGTITFTSAQASEDPHPYHMLAIYSQDNEAVIVTFETTAEMQKSWAKVGETITTSLRFIEKK